MSLERSILISAVIIALAIIASPSMLQSYKMSQCVTALEKLSGESSSATESACLQYIN